MGTVDSHPDEAGPGALALLRRRDFGIYWWSAILSGPGNWLHNVTASVLMLTMTGSPFMVGVVNFAIFVPTLLFSLPAGSLGDRFEKRRVVTAAQACGCVFAIVLTVLSATDRLSPVTLTALCFLLGTVTAVTKPSLSAMIPALVPRSAVARATALNVMQFQLAQVAGPGLASVILLVATPAWGFGINAASFLAPVVAMQLIRLDRPSSATGTVTGEASAQLGGSIAEGVRFIARHPAMPAILVTVVLSNGAVEALRTLAPTLADDRGQPALAGVLIMGHSIGALIGLVSFGAIERILPRRWILGTAFTLQAAGVACVALAPSLLLTVLAAAPIGVGFSLSTPLLSAALQNLSPDDARSRVMATFSMAHLGLRPIFALVAGGLAALVGAPWALVPFAVVAAGAAVMVQRRQVAQE